MTNLIALPNGTELVGDYRIERVLGAGGFGVTYLADEIALGRLVTIKEYFPSDIAARTPDNEAAPRSQDCAGDYRWGLDRFIAEAQTLARFDHPNIVRVYRYFLANNTGYMVLHFEEGKSLKTWLKELGRAPRQKELDAIVAPLLDALELIHRSDYLHRDIAPDNIIIRKTGGPVLIDFGSARGEIASQTKTVSALVKPGYSPYEQYAETARSQGPWSDIYALGGTLYHAVTGKRPPDAPSRMINDELVPAREAAVGAYRANFLKAIDRALALSVEGRPQSIPAWRGDLLAPDPQRTRWLGRARDGEERPVAAKAKTAPAAAILPQPDAPGPKGVMLDAFEALGKKPSGEPAAAASAKGEEAHDRPVDAPAVATPKGAKAAKVEKVSPEKAGPAVPPGEAAPLARPRRALVPVAKPAQPRPIRSARRRWAPLAFKLLIGVGVASAAVAVQDRLPQVESRGAGLPSSETTQSLQSPAAVTPTAEIAAHRGAVTGLAYSGDGRTMVTAGDDGTLKVWDSARNTLQRTIELDDGGATSLALFGTRALTGHANGRVVVWDIEKAQKVASMQRNAASIWAVAFLGDADRLAVASHDWKVALWDVRQPSAPVHVLEGHENAVQAIAYAPAPMLIATGGADRAVRLWDATSLDAKRTYRGNRDFVTAVAFSPSGRMLAAGAQDGRIALWSSLSSRRLRSLPGHRGRIAAVAFAPIGQALASASEDGTVRLWDLRRARTLRTLTGHAGGATAVAFAPAADRLATASRNGVVRLWAMPLARLASD